MDQKPRRFQFGLRDLLWGMLVVGLIIGWAVDRRALSIALEDWAVRRGLQIEEYRQEIRYLHHKHGDPDGKEVPLYSTPPLRSAPTNRMRKKSQRG